MLAMEAEMKINGMTGPAEVVAMVDVDKKAVATRIASTHKFNASWKLLRAINKHTNGYYLSLAFSEISVLLKREEVPDNAS